MRKILNHLTTDWYKYLLELIVIMAGILGAYTLNDWSDRRQRHKTELEILSEIKTNLQLDLIDLKQNSNGHERGLRLLDSLGNAEEYKLDNYQIGFYLSVGFRDYVYLPQTSAFATLKAKGVDLVANDSLRIDILRLYDFHFNGIVSLESDYKPSQFTDDYKYIVYNYFDKMYLQLDSVELSIVEPKFSGYDWLQNGDVQVRLDQTMGQRQFMKKIYDDVIPMVNDLIVRIEEEL